MAFECSDEEKITPNAVDCGCGGGTMETLTDVDAKVEYPQNGFLRIFLVDRPTVALLPCNLSDSDLDRISVDQKLIKISGKVKYLCPDTRRAGNDFEMTKIEILRK